MIGFDIILHRQRTEPVKRIVYYYKNADFDTLRPHIRRVPFDLAITERSDNNEYWQNWKNLFLSSVDEFVPKKFVVDKNMPLWIDHEVKHFIRKKYTALRRYRENQTHQRKANSRRLTQNVKDMIKRKHKEY